jgi:hypothetical protein
MGVGSLAWERVRIVWEVYGIDFTPELHQQMGIIMTEVLATESKRPVAPPAGRGRGGGRGRGRRKM